MVLMLTDVLLLVVAFVSCVLLVMASRSWADYAVSSRNLRLAYGALFGAPFALLLVLAPAQFIRIEHMQSTLCQERLRDLLPKQRELQAVCEGPIEDWAGNLATELERRGRMRDPSTGSCPAADEALARAQADFAASGRPCVDVSPEVIAAYQTAIPGVASCNDAAELGLCTFPEMQLRSAVHTGCPLACQLCTITPACEDHDSRFAEWDNPQGISTCAQAFSAGFCSHADEVVRGAIIEACPLACGQCAGECADRNEAWAIQGYPNGISSCADVTALGANSINLCNSADANVQSQVHTICPVTCDVCPASRRKLQSSIQVNTAANDLLGSLSNGLGSESQIMKMDGCFDQVVVEAVKGLEVALSDAVIIGAIAVRRGATVLATLVPAALGLALGAGQGATLSKTVLPSSRQPARLSGIIVSLSTAFIAALLSVINQLLASGWGTAATSCILAALLVWLPLGATTGRLAKFSQPITHPAPIAQVIKAIAKRKQLVSIFNVLTLVFLICFLGVSEAFSLVTQQLDETTEATSEALAEGNKSGDWTMLLLLVLPITQTVLNVIAKTYLAQMFYTDAATVAITFMAHSDSLDGEEEAEQRAAELDEVAEALKLQMGSKKVTTAAKVLSSTINAPATSTV